MKKIFDDKLGHRSLSHINFVVFQGQALKFEGKSLPGCRIISKNYTKNGKWSHSTWECELADGVEALIISQDWESGAWFTEQTWEAVCSRQDLATLTDPEKFVRVHFPQNACRLDDERASTPPVSAMAEAFMALTKAQAELATAQAERYRLEYEAKKVATLQREIERTTREIELQKSETERLRSLLSQSEETLLSAKEVAQELETAKAELAEVVSQKEDQERRAEMQKRTEVLRSAKGKKMSLTDLQALLKK